MAAQDNNQYFAAQPLQPPPPMAPMHLPGTGGYNYWAPQQLYPFMSVFYQNVQHQQQQQQQPVSASAHWLERNGSPKVDAEDEGDGYRGYWDLPRTTYGALASSAECEPKAPRIGAEFQAEIPSISDCNAKKQEFEDRCVWESGRVSPDHLDEYLKTVQFVLGICLMLILCARIEKQGPCVGEQGHRGTPCIRTAITTKRRHCIC